MTTPRWAVAALALALLAGCANGHTVSGPPFVAAAFMMHRSDVDGAVEWLAPHRRSRRLVCTSMLVQATRFVCCSPTVQFYTASVVDPAVALDSYTHAGRWEWTLSLR